MTSKIRASCLGLLSHLMSDRLIGSRWYFPASYHIWLQLMYGAMVDTMAELGRAIVSSKGNESTGSCTAESTNVSTQYQFLCTVCISLRFENNAKRRRGSTEEVCDFSSLCAQAYTRSVLSSVIGVL
jgi:hypothetical protein